GAGGPGTAAHEPVAATTRERARLGRHGPALARAARALRPGANAPPARADPPVCELPDGPRSLPLPGGALDRVRPLPRAGRALHGARQSRALLRRRWADPRVAPLAPRQQLGRERDAPRGALVSRLTSHANDCRARSAQRADGQVRQGSTGPVPARGQRTPRLQVEPSRNRAARACRVVPRSLPHLPVGPGAVRWRALAMTSRT